MAQPPAYDIKARQRIEFVIKVFAPALNLVLSIGEHVSRLTQPEDHEYYPVSRPGDPQPPYPD